MVESPRSSLNKIAFSSHQSSSFISTISAISSSPPHTYRSIPPFVDLTNFWSHRELISPFFSILTAIHSLFAYTDDPHQPIQVKIRSAFQNFEVYGFGGLVQFWGLAETCGKKLLKTSHQPFALANRDEGLDKYRLSCLKHEYEIFSGVIGHDGSPAIAFVNQMPLILMDLISSALECGLMHSILLPVFYPSGSCCVGVLGWFIVMFCSAENLGGTVWTCS